MLAGQCCIVLLKRLQMVNFSNNFFPKLLLNNSLFIYTLLFLVLF